MSFGFSLLSGMVQNSLYGLSPTSGIEEWFIDRLQTSNNRVLQNIDCPKASDVPPLQLLKVDGF